MVEIVTGKTIDTLIEDIYNIFECAEEVEVKEADLERFVKGVVDSVVSSLKERERSKGNLRLSLIGQPSRSCPGRTRLSSCMETYSNLF
jgi:hypothetical protein